MSSKDMNPIKYDIIEYNPDNYPTYRDARKDASASIDVWGKLVKNKRNNIEQKIITIKENIQNFFNTSINDRSGTLMSPSPEAIKDFLTDVNNYIARELVNEIKFFQNTALTKKDVVRQVVQPGGANLGSTNISQYNVHKSINNRKKNNAKDDKMIAANVAAKRLANSQKKINDKKRNKERAIAAKQFSENKYNKEKYNPYTGYNPVKKSISVKRSLEKNRATKSHAKAINKATKAEESAHQNLKNMTQGYNFFNPVLLENIEEIRKEQFEHNSRNEPLPPQFQINDAVYYVLNGKTDALKGVIVNITAPDVGKREYNYKIKYDPVVGQKKSSEKDNVKVRQNNIYADDPGECKWNARNPSTNFTTKNYNKIIKLINKNNKLKKIILDTLNKLSVKTDSTGTNDINKFDIAINKDNFYIYWNTLLKVSRMKQDIWTILDNQTSIFETLTNYIKITHPVTNLQMITNERNADIANIDRSTANNNEDIKNLFYILNNIKDKCPQSNGICKLLHEVIQNLKSINDRILAIIETRNRSTEYKLPYYGIVTSSNKILEAITEKINTDIREIDKVQPQSEYLDGLLNNLCNLLKLQLLINCQVIYNNILTNTIEDDDYSDFSYRNMVRRIDAAEN